jgi:hypothetical protein
MGGLSNFDAVASHFSTGKGLQKIVIPDLPMYQNILKTNVKEVLPYWDFITLKGFELFF